MDRFVLREKQGEDGNWVVDVSALAPLNSAEMSTILHLCGECQFHSRVTGVVSVTALSITFGIIEAKDYQGKDCHLCVQDLMAKINAVGRVAFVLEKWELSGVWMPVYTVVSSMPVDAQRALLKWCKRAGVDFAPEYVCLFMDGSIVHGDHGAYRVKKTPADIV